MTAYAGVQEELQQQFDPRFGGDKGFEHKGISRRLKIIVFT